LTNSCKLTRAYQPQSNDLIQINPLQLFTSLFLIA
jgi:hypothetical protein